MLSRRAVLSLGLLMAAPRLALASPSGLTGVWTTLFVLGGRKLRGKFDVSADSVVAFTSLDQGGSTVFGRVQASEGAVTFDLPAARARFQGRAVGTGRLVGVWIGGDMEMPLTLVRGVGGYSADRADEGPPLTSDSLARLRLQANAPALAAAAQRRGASTRLWADGVRMLGSDVSVTTGDQWHLGSVSKSMLATVVARLVEAGRLTWDDTLGEVLGAEQPGMSPGYRGATFRHLLSHRAGLIDNPPLEAMQTFARSVESAAVQRKSYLAEALSIRPSSGLGASTTYSNVGYVAAAAMMETRTGEPWRELMRRYLFQPLDLTSAGFGAPGRPGALDEPVGHGSFFGTPYQAHPPGDPNSDLPDVMAPAGAVHMDLADLITYLSAHRDRTGLLREASWKTLQEPPFGGNYALGWWVGAGGSLWHSGSDLLWYAEASVDRQSGVVAAAVANDGRGAGPGAGAGEIPKAVAQASAGAIAAV